MASSPRPRWNVAQYSLPIIASRPSVPFSVPDSVRRALSRMISRPMWAPASRWRIAGSSATPVRRASAMMASSSLRKLSCWPSVDAPRSKASVPIATFQPSPSPPTTLAASVRAPSKNTSLNSLSPVTCTMGRISMPSWRIGTSRYDSPPCLRRGSAGGECGPARSTSRPSGPARSTPSGRGRSTRRWRRRARPGWRRWPGRSRRRARSSPGTTARRPATIGGRKRCCCSGEPKAISVGPSRPSPMWPRRPGPCARAYSS